MKVVIINAHYTHTLGGSEIQCHQIAYGLTEWGIDLVYLAVGGYDSAIDLPYKVLAVEKNSKSIVQACKQLQTDVIYWRFNKTLLASVIKEVKPFNMQLIFSVSHIHDLKPFAYKPIPNLSVFGRLKRRIGHLIKGLKFQSAFKKIDGVVCNNEEHLSHITHANKIYIPNSPFLEFEEFSWPRPYVVWVGNIKAHKHPELFIDLAKSFEHQRVDFLMVGDIQQQAYEYLKTSKELPGNFYYLGPKRIFETNGVIKSSLFLIHTCEPEGFPNVFLQAWGFEKPVVSAFFDPGSMIEKYDVGRISNNLSNLYTDVEQLIKDQQLRNEIGLRARDLIDREFIRTSNVKKLLGFIKEIQHS